MSDQLIPIGNSTRALAVANANVTDEIDRAGRSFGNLVLTTGKAVAETMKKLNETGAASATALANTLVDVIALQEKVFDDNGNVIDIKTHVEHLPLVNFIDPVFYEWTQVRLQGTFYANEFAATSSGEQSTSSSDGSGGQGGLMLILGAGYNTYDSQRQSSKGESKVDDDVSVGNVRMNALLQPRTDIGVPKPTQVIQGPRLAVIHGAVSEIKTGELLTSREMGVLIQYHRRDGTPIQGKSISVETPGVAWSFVAGQVTDGEGNLEIKLRREFLDEEADTTQKDFVVTARIGIVQNNSTVTF